MGRSRYGAHVMQVWLAVTCPTILIVTLGDVLESGNAKNRVNLARFLCARCGVLYILRVVYIYAHTVRCAGVHAQKCESKHLKIHVTWSFGFPLSPMMQKTMCEYPFLIKVGH